MQAKGSRGPVVWPLLLILIGVVLLLDNFLLLESFNITALSPLLLVVAGAVILLRGDVVLDDSTRNFGITRGSVESALLEISSGEIDVRMRDLTREGRLIAGQFAANARPSLNVDDVYAHLRFDRAATPWISFADWELSLARDLPWQLFISTSLGEVDLNLGDVIVDGGMIATGLANIRLTCPQETLNPLYLRSAIGNITVAAPLGAKARIMVEGGRLLDVHTDERRYSQPEPGLYVTRDVDPDAPLVELHLSGTFGDIYLT